MKKIILLICLLAFSGRLLAQREAIDSLKHLLSNARTDSVKTQIIAELSNKYEEYNPDSSLYYANGVYSAGKRSNNQKLINYALAKIAFANYIKGNFPVALDNALHVLRMIESGKNMKSIANIYNMIGNIYKGQQNYPRALYYYRRCKQEAILGRDTTDLTYSYFNMANVYDLTNVPDSAIIYAKKALVFVRKVADGSQTDIVLAILGDAYAKQGDNKMAYSYLRRAYAQNQKKNSYKRNSTLVCAALSKYFKRIGKRDSAIYYAYKALGYANAVRFKNAEYISFRLLSSLYENDYNIDSAYKYLKLSSAANDSLYNTQRMQESEALTVGEEGRLKEIEQAKATYINGIKMSLLIAGLIIFLMVAGLLWRNNRQKQKANHLLNKQKEEIASQRDDLGQALEALKQTQTQLIQSEKMASLGELTAGIAHEIQNPLNFVNNFSEVNTELIDEMQQEMDKGDYDEAKAIAADIKENQIKINQHGKRADFIVKGMLQHSRTSTGERELTNMNTLADEFLKLSYHGLRAKDKNFNAELVTHFDETLPKINIVQQDIGRVLLNLFNNAFYAVNQKQKSSTPDYKPTVTVSTRIAGTFVLITVRDNGAGIPQKIVDKIYQPFFTTKPSGQGTGLGLSLSYDIVKANGGDISVETQENIFTQFNVQLPLI
jgi:two-component system NtrC family sensor kinase